MALWSTAFLAALPRRAAALALLLLAGFLGSCSKPGGPFVSVTIMYWPSQADDLQISVLLAGDTTPRTAALKPSVPPAPIPLTIELDPGRRGDLTIQGIAIQSSTRCQLGQGTLTLSLDDDRAYTGTLNLLGMPPTGCAVQVARLTVSVAGAGAARISSDPSGVDLVCPTGGCVPASAVFERGTQVSLTARAALGYSFNLWSDPACLGQSTCKLTMDGDKTVSASFFPCTGWCEESSSEVTTDLYGVWAADANTAYAVGASGVILRRETGAWQQMTSNTGQPLYAVNGFQSALYAAGGAGTILAFEGGRWVKISVPTVALTETLRTMNIDQGGYVFALGTKGTYLRRDPGAQSFIVDGADLKGKDILAADVKVGGSGALAGNRTFVTADSRVFEYSCFLNRAEQNLAIGAINDVWMQDADTVYVVSATGLISRGTRNGLCVLGGWTAQTSGVTSALRSIHGTGANNIYIVGDNGVILKSTNGTTWSPETVPRTGTKQLNGVFTIGTDVYIVGNGGLILHYRP